MEEKARGRGGSRRAARRGGRGAGAPRSGTHHGSAPGPRPTLGRPGGAGRRRLPPAARVWPALAGGQLRPRWPLGLPGRGASPGRAQTAGPPSGAAPSSARDPAAAAANRPGSPDTSRPSAPRPPVGSPDPHPRSPLLPRAVDAPLFPPSPGSGRDGFGFHAGRARIAPPCPAAPAQDRGCLSRAGRVQALTPWGPSALLGCQTLTGSDLGIPRSSLQPTWGRAEGNKKPGASPTPLGLAHPPPAFQLLQPRALQTMTMGSSVLPQEGGGGGN